MPPLPGGAVRGAGGSSVGCRTSIRPIVTVMSGFATAGSAVRTACSRGSLSGSVIGGMPVASPRDPSPPGDDCGGVGLGMATGGPCGPWSRRPAASTDWRTSAGAVPHTGSSPRRGATSRAGTVGAAWPPAWPSRAAAAGTSARCPRPGVTGTPGSSLDAGDRESCEVEATNWAAVTGSSRSAAGEGSVSKPSRWAAGSSRREVWAGACSRP